MVVSEGNVLFVIIDYRGVIEGKIRGELDAFGCKVKCSSKRA